MTLVCVPIFVESPDDALADARAARDGGADLVEFRIDTYFTGDGFESAGAGGAGPSQADALLRLIALSPLPCIVTCRPVLEGGHYGGPDSARIALLERLGNAAPLPEREHPPRYLDVELATYTRSANIKQKVNLAVDHPGQLRDLGASLILSAHDFNSRPPDLIRQLERMYTEPACRVVKVAYRARSLRDNLELLDIVAENQAGAGGGKPIIALAMGPFGLMSRVLAPKFGAFLTFASLRRSSGTAPGQPVLSELLDLYRFRSIGTGTGVYGVVGWPVEHSLSPHVHNAGFEAIGHDGVYLPLPIPPEYEHFKATVLAMVDHPHLDLRGLSVTMPHKEHLVRLAQEEWEAGDGRWSLDVLSQRCGSANTLVIDREPRGGARRLMVANTDGPAAAAALGDEARDVIVLGAGGTARAVATELLHRGRRVIIANRTRERAEALAAEIARATSQPPPEVADLAGPPPSGAGAIINCTSAGMATGGPGEDRGNSPVPAEWIGNLRAPRIVVECVYNPLQTPFLELGARMGARVVDGLTMFVSQAGEQFRLWTQQPAPVRLFEQVARETLLSRGQQDR